MGKQSTNGAKYGEIQIEIKNLCDSKTAPYSPVINYPVLFNKLGYSPSSMPLDDYCFEFLRKNINDPKYKAHGYIAFIDLLALIIGSDNQLKRATTTKERAMRSAKFGKYLANFFYLFLNVDTFEKTLSFFETDFIFYQQPDISIDFQPRLLLKNVQMRAHLGSILTGAFINLSVQQIDRILELPVFKNCSDLINLQKISKQEKLKSIPISITPVVIQQTTQVIQQQKQVIQQQKSLQSTTTTTPSIINNNNNNNKNKNNNDIIIDDTQNKKRKIDDDKIEYNKEENEMKNFISEYNLNFKNEEGIAPWISLDLFKKKKWINSCC
jgi:hypothetical protein